MVCIQYVVMIHLSEQARLVVNITGLIYVQDMYK